MKLSNESKTLFIPLYGKALMSKNNLFIRDLKAEEIVKDVNFDFDSLKQSKWLSMYMAVRARVIDDICNGYIKKYKDVVVIQLGCGLDSRNIRISQDYDMWYDIDFENVISIRSKFYKDNDKYKMIGRSVTDLSWLEEVSTKKENILVIAEGLTMYLEECELKSLIDGLYSKFGDVTIVFDAYSKKTVKASKYKNPVNKMSVTIKWGMNDIDDFLKLHNKLVFIDDYLIRYKEDNLKCVTKFVFENLYCGKIAESYYKIYKYELKK